jgi:hypothetical protein
LPPSDPLSTRIRFLPFAPSVCQRDKSLKGEDPATMANGPLHGAEESWNMTPLISVCEESHCPCGHQFSTSVLSLIWCSLLRDLWYNVVAKILWCKLSPSWETVNDWKTQWWPRDDDHHFWHWNDVSRPCRCHFSSWEPH